MKNSVAHMNARQKELLTILEKRGQMTTLELATALDVSISTVRRDLNILEEKNDIIRQYGSCSFNHENQKNFDQSGPELIKQALAKAASHYVNDYDTVFINSSSTALNIVNYLKSKHLTIVTNNLKIAYSPHNPNYNYILTGGELRFPKEVLVGDIANETIAAMNADVCIIGCSGVSIENGITTRILNEARINALMITQTVKCKLLVADHRKIEVTSKFKIADLSVFDYLITDKYCPTATITEIERTGVKVIQVS